ncbi:UNKNOWN [Stylonychia lemnae]|uniref:Uncharacterized protein n=1 Tax=Stylonychia lemnae TaxID=5949 RepID=A0A078AP41_STYLE|nr:UNKNOWN [Stylonychia lemnae]|eukprot:CDW83087.1 UNKNOWN [Stylonychia lemnae]
MLTQHKLLYLSQRYMTKQEAQKIMQILPKDNGLINDEYLKRQKNSKNFKMLIQDLRQTRKATNSVKEI